MKNLWPISQEWLEEKKCMFYKQISHSYWYKSWVYNREKQLQYLSQSAQLEEAGNPWLVRTTRFTANGCRAGLAMSKSCCEAIHAAFFKATVQELIMT